MPDILSSRKSAVVRQAEAIQVAREFAALAREDEDDQFTAMKLQKLLYYAQAWCLYQRGFPLFSESIKAFERGPVVHQVFKKFQGMYRINLDHPELAESSDLSEGDQELVFGVWQLYKRYSGDELSELTHEYAAFQRARAKASRLLPNPSIRQADMPREIREYLRQQDEWHGAFVQGRLKR